MTITINFKPQASPGYTPHKALTLCNVESVHDMGVGAVQVQMTFSDLDITYDHVASVVVLPAKDY
jgi:hypothetical protein